MTTRMEQHSVELSTPAVLKSVLAEFSAVTDYRTLRDSLPRRLSSLLKCRHVLLYQRIGETLQFASGTFDERPGWSSFLLDFVHINPIDIKGETPEARAWRLRNVVTAPAESSTPTLVTVPLIYRQHAIGVLVARRGGPTSSEEGYHDYWTGEEVEVVEVVAGVSAMLLENTRLLERDRERIHELSLLNSISSQLHCSMYELSRVHNIVIQRTKEIATVDLCELMEEPMGKPDEAAWITPTLRAMLFQYFREQRSFSPLIIERPGDPLHPFVQDYLDQLSAHIKTFFAIPLLNGRGIGRHDGSLLRGG